MEVVDPFKILGPISLQIQVIQICVPQKNCLRQVIRAMPESKRLFSLDVFPYFLLEQATS